MAKGKSARTRRAGTEDDVEEGYLALHNGVSWVYHGNGAGLFEQ